MRRYCSSVSRLSMEVLDSGRRSNDFHCLGRADCGQVDLQIPSQYVATALASRCNVRQPVEEARVRKPLALERAHAPHDVDRPRSITGNMYSTVNHGHP